MENPRGKRGFRKRRINHDIRRTISNTPKKQRSDVKTKGGNHRWREGRNQKHQKKGGARITKGEVGRGDAEGKRREGLKKDKEKRKSAGEVLTKYKIKGTERWQEEGTQVAQTQRVAGEWESEGRAPKKKDRKRAGESSGGKGGPRKQNGIRTGLKKRRSRYKRV